MDEKWSAPSSDQNIRYLYTGTVALSTMGEKRAERKYVRLVKLPIKMILVEMTNDLYDAYRLKMTT